MAGRIYVCPIVTQDILDEFGQPTGGIQQLALIITLEGVIRCRSIISTEASGANRGRARLPWTLVYADATDWTAVEASSQCYRLDDQLADALTNPVRNQLASRSVATRAETDPIATIRDCIAYLVDKHYPGVTFEQAFPEFA
jgi:hypothetical protein